MTDRAEMREGGGTMEKAGAADEYERCAGISLPKAVFDGVWAMMDSAIMSVPFQKKIRIVLEYDPQKEKWEINYFRPRDEQCMKVEDLEERKQ